MLNMICRNSNTYTFHQRQFLKKLCRTEDSASALCTHVDSRLDYQLQPCEDISSQWIVAIAYAHIMLECIAVKNSRIQRFKICPNISMLQLHSRTPGSSLFSLNSKANFLPRMWQKRELVRYVYFSIVAACARRLIARTAVEETERKRANGHIV